MSTAHITDEVLDRLSAELRAMAAEVASTDYFNSDDRHTASDLVLTLTDLAVDRPMMAMFAVLLSRHATRESALAEITREPATAA